MKYSQEQIEDAQDFQDEFHVWLEKHGVTIGELVGDRFVCTIDLNKLKLAILKLERDAF